MVEEKSKFDEKLEADQAKWPSHVKEMNIGMLGYLGYSEDGNLYWDGKPIEVKKSLDLNRWQVILAVMTAIGAFLSGIIALLKFVLETLS